MHLVISIKSAKYKLTEAKAEIQESKLKQKIFVTNIDILHSKYGREKIEYTIGN